MTTQAMCGGLVKKFRTKTEAQGYMPDWPALERRFPAIAGMVTYAEKWAYIESRMKTSFSDRMFVKAHRPKVPNTHRVILDRVVTDDFVEDIVDNLIAEGAPFGDYKYHHSGTGVGAEAAADSGLGTPELDARTVGTQAENGSKVYQSVVTETFDGVAAITEHGLFNTAGAGGPPVTGGILMDRTKFAAINVVNLMQIEWTFEMTFASGG